MKVGWIEATLGDVAELRAGVGFPVELQGRATGAYPMTKVADVSRAGREGARILEGADHYVDDADLARLHARPVPAGSVLFAKIGEAIRGNHRVVAGVPMAFDNNVMAAVPRDVIDGTFLFHYLCSQDFYKLASTTSVPALRKSTLEKLTVPLPPLDEQRRIARVLDKAAAAVLLSLDPPNSGAGSRGSV